MIWSEECTLGGSYEAVVHRPSQVAIGHLGDFAAAWSALDEAFLDEERLIYFLHSAAVFADGSGYGAYSHRASPELVDDCEQYLIVYLIQSVAVYVQSFQSIASYFQVYASASLNLSKVAHTSKQGVGYTWCTSTA